jgi:hypothetical protein
MIPLDNVIEFIPKKHSFVFLDYFLEVGKVPFDHCTHNHVVWIEWSLIFTLSKCISVWDVTLILLIY